MRAIGLAGCAGCYGFLQDTSGLACRRICRRHYSAGYRYKLIDSNPATGCKGKCFCVVNN